MVEILTLSAAQEVRSAFTNAAFSQIALREGLLCWRRAAFPAADLTLPQLSVFGDVLLAQESDGDREVLLRPEPEMLLRLSYFHGHGVVDVAGMHMDAVDRVVTDLVETLRDPEPHDDQVPVTFWAYSRSELHSPRRKILAPAWHEIRENYAVSAREALDGLMAATEPGPGGLILWHGDPGTGKSHALRGLAREWHGWCDTHFVTDADVCLGAGSGYLLDVLLRKDSRDGHAERWKLIVFEDAGELLAADARAIAGQGLSRLLNLTDGLLGAGLRTLVLVTTNEPLRKLHPAVVRPGRTWAEVEFPTLTADEANLWLARREVQGPVDHPITLAEGFALARGRPVTQHPGLGFSPR
jgi:hypothetical protein